MFGMHGQQRTIGMPSELFRELAAAAARQGVTPARLLQDAIDGTRGPVASRSSPAPRAAARAAPMATASRPAPEFCGACDREIGGPAVSRCKCNDAPPVPRLAAGVRPIAFECSLLESFKAYQALGGRPPDSTVRHYQASTKASGGVALALLHGEIGASMGTSGTTGSAFCVNLDAARAAGAKALLLDVNSSGGLVTESLAIARGLRRFSNEVGPVVAYVANLAGSGASLAAVSADYVVIAPQATVFIHEPQGGRDDHRPYLRNALEDIYTARTLAPREQLAGYMAGAVTFDSCMAVSYGFADEVGSSQRASAIARQAASTGRLYGSQIAAGPEGQPLAYASWRHRTLADRKAQARAARR
jgi:ATP-dependent protease ClpP protease subunit